MKKMCRMWLTTFAIEALIINNKKKKKNSSSNGFKIFVSVE